MRSFPLTVATGVGLALLVHWWPRLAAPWRRRASLSTSLAGLVALVAAVRAEGLREAALTSVVLVGPAYQTATASAAASDCYYVLTAVCLLLGFAGLAFGEPLARLLLAHPLPASLAMAWLATLVRVLLEKSAAPALLVQSVGVTWMAPVAGAYIASAAPVARLRPLVRTLAAYAFLVRGFVAFVSVVATLRRSGTHYDVSGFTEVTFAVSGGASSFAPAGWQQLLWLVLVPQLLAWPVYTVAAALLGAAIALRVRRRQALTPVGTAPAAPA